MSNKVEYVITSKVQNLVPVVMCVQYEKLEASE